MKDMKKTSWGAIALAIALVLASSLTLTGCENGPGSGRGFDPVGTWRGTHIETWHGSQGTVHERSEFTLTLWANGTGTLRMDVFQNNIFTGTDTVSITYSVTDNIITIISHGSFGGPQQIVGVFSDNNTFILNGITFRRN